MKQPFLDRLAQLPDHTLFTIAGKPISIVTVCAAVAILIATLWISRLLRAAVKRAMTRRGVRAGTAAALARLLHYTVLTVGLGIALQTVGVELSALFAAGAIFAVAIGFAMQNIAQNFVSGVILLVERSIKPGDVLGVEEQVVRVVAMRIRSTIAQTRDGEDLVIPNSVLVQSTVKNYTLENSSYRVRATVGVLYSSDMTVVERTLQRVADGISWRLEQPDPQVVLTEFGDNAVIWEAAVWMADPWLARPALSKLNRAIWDAFQQEGIVIAFPQLDVHFDPPVAEGLRKLGVRAG